MYKVAVFSKLFALRLEVIHEIAVAGGISEKIIGIIIMKPK